MILTIQGEYIERRKKKADSETMIEVLGEEEDATLRRRTASGEIAVEKTGDVE